MTDMTSNRPYLIRATHEWICDNGLTTHLAVNVMFPGVEVPQDYVQDGQIVLNISPSAVTNFVADNEEIAFTARFGGVPMTIRVPVDAVVAVFARENGQGMAFEAVEPPETPPPSKGINVSRETPDREKKSEKSDKAKVSHLKVVK